MDARTVLTERLIIDSSTGHARLGIETPIAPLQPDQSVALVHHAMTEARKVGRVQGRQDTDLEHRDVFDMADFQDVLDGFVSTDHHMGDIVIYSSPAKRALETANQIRIELHHRGLEAIREVRIDQRLIDMSQGSWEGNLKSDLVKEPLWQRFALGRDFLVKAPGLSSDGSMPESLLDVLERTYPFFCQLSQQTYSSIVVGHKVSTVVPGLIFYCPVLLAGEDGILNWRKDNLYSLNHLITSVGVTTYRPVGKESK